VANDAVVETALNAKVSEGWINSGTLTRR